MALDKALHGKRDPDAVTMDRIRVPDTENMKKLSDKPYRSTGTSAADEILSGGRPNRQTRIGAADNKYEGSEKRLRDRRYYEEKKYDDDFIPKPDPKRTAPRHLDQGVRVGSSYVARKKVIIWIVSALLLLGCALVFLPPLVNSVSEETRVDHGRKIFEDMGKTEFMSFALANYSVYNEDAFTSDRNASYRVIELNVFIQNSSPFEVLIPQYKAAYVPARYKDKVCYVTSTARAATKEGDGKVVGDRIESFSGKNITIEIMINVSDMTDAELDDCITNMVLSSVGAKKRVAKDIYVPCLPAYLFISDTVEVPLDPD